MNGLLDYQCEVHESGYEIVTNYQMHELRYKGRVKPSDEGTLRKDTFWVKPIERLSPIRHLNIINHPGVFYEFVNFTLLKQHWDNIHR